MPNFRFKNLENILVQLWQSLEHQNFVVRGNVLEYIEIE